MWVLGGGQVTRSDPTPSTHRMEGLKPINTGPFANIDQSTPTQPNQLLEGRTLSAGSLTSPAAMASFWACLDCFVSKTPTLTP